MPDLISYSFMGWITNTNLKLIFSSTIILLIIAAVAIGVDFLIRKTIISYVNGLFRNSRLRLVRLLEEFHVLNSLALCVFGLVFIFGSFLLAENNKPVSIGIATFILKSANLFNLYILTLSINRFIYALHEYYQQVSERDDKSSWHSYIKIFSFFTWLLVAILAIAYIYGQPPASILTGLGALTGIVLLIFRDTFLGIVSSIQANATSMVRIGDWISINKYDIDGVVEEISINSVRIRNFDNTVTTIPTYTLTTEAVKNWEYMNYVAARRFKQAIWIDPRSIQFFSPATLEDLSCKLPGLTKIIQEKSAAADTYSNLSWFRMYIQAYLNNHAALNHDYSNLIRLTPATNNGQPLEITAFTLDTTSTKHEELKALILEFSYASMAEFQLSPVLNSN